MKYFYHFVFNDNNSFYLQKPDNMPNTETAIAV